MMNLFEVSKEIGVLALLPCLLLRGPINRVLRGKATQ